MSMPAVPVSINKGLCPPLSCASRAEEGGGSPCTCKPRARAHCRVRSLRGYTKLLTAFPLPLCSAYKLVRADGDFIITIPAFLCTIDNWTSLLTVSLPLRKVGALKAAERSRATILADEELLVLTIEVRRGALLAWISLTGGCPGSLPVCSHWHAPGLVRWGWCVLRLALLCACGLVHAKPQLCPTSSSCTLPRPPPCPQVDLQGKPGYKFAAVVAAPPAGALPADERWRLPGIWVLEETARELLGAVKDYGIWDKGVVHAETESVRRSSGVASEPWRLQVFEQLKQRGKYAPESEQGWPGRWPCWATSGAWRGVSCVAEVSCVPEGGGMDRPGLRHHFWGHACGSTADITCLHHRHIAQQLWRGARWAPSVSQSPEACTPHAHALAPCLAECTGNLISLEAVLYVSRTQPMMDLRKRLQQLCGKEDSKACAEVETLALESLQRTVRLHRSVQATLRGAGVDIPVMDYEGHEAMQARGWAACGLRCRCTP